MPQPISGGILQLRAGAILFVDFDVSKFSIGVDRFGQSTSDSNSARATVADPPPEPPEILLKMPLQGLIMICFKILGVVGAVVSLFLAVSGAPGPARKLWGEQ